MDRKSTEEPIICFGQQPCGFFPRRFLFAKVMTARRLQSEVGGRIVFFFHDSDHDPRETTTILQDKRTGREARLNFAFVNQVQKRYSPLYAKSIAEGWTQKMLRQLPNYVGPRALEAFRRARGTNVADFCLSVYREMGLLEGIDVRRSGDPQFREGAMAVDDYFVDVPWEGEVVRARRCTDGSLRLHQGGDVWKELPPTDYTATAVSPARDTRLRWMQSVIQCTHYIAGAGEIGYLNCHETPEITFVRRDEIERPSDAYVE